MGSYSGAESVLARKTTRTSPYYCIYLLLPSSLGGLAQRYSITYISVQKCILYDHLTRKGNNLVHFYVNKASETLVPLVVVDRYRSHIIPTVNPTGLTNGRPDGYNGIIPSIEICSSIDCYVGITV